MRLARVKAGGNENSCPDDPCRTPVLRVFAPQLRGGAAGALGERLQFEPDDLGVDLNATREGSKAAIYSSDDVLASNQVGKIQDTVGNEFRMLYRVDG